jgi:hypothetical protein
MTNHHMMKSARLLLLHILEQEPGSAYYTSQVAFAERLFSCEDNHQVYHTLLDDLCWSETREGFIFWQSVALLTLHGRDK